jgi:hypothetical protein
MFGVVDLKADQLFHGGYRKSQHHGRTPKLESNVDASNSMNDVEGLRRLCAEETEEEVKGQEGVV